METSTNIYNISDEISSDTASDIVYELAAIGVNSSSRGYHSTRPELISGFLKLPKSDLCKMWTHLETPVKVKYIDGNEDLFLEWLKDD